MKNPQIAPYGSWPSPLTAESLATAGIKLRDVRWDKDTLYWLELRPHEEGRYVIVRRTANGQTSDALPTPFSARSRVHEYGGGTFTVHQDVIYFSNDADGRIYALAPGKSPIALTPPGKLRYADFQVDSGRGRLFCVQEDHSSLGEPLNRLVKVPLAGGTPEVVAEGSDFYSSPRLSPDGQHLAWITWNHPGMPWDSSALWLGAVEGENPPRCLVQNPRESIVEPQWSPQGLLHFVSDRSGFWNLYAWTEAGPRALCPREAEFSQPPWVFGQSAYGFFPDGAIFCTYCDKGIWKLAFHDTRWREIESPFTDIDTVRTNLGAVAFLGASPRATAAVIVWDRDTEIFTTIEGTGSVFPAALMSAPESISFPTDDGGTGYAFYYPPYQEGFVAPAGEKPPLLVTSHGGPTAATTAALDKEILFWTTRGFGFLDVNYGGSTGYGRRYRERLEGQWGVVDVKDCISAAQSLVKAGRVDRNRIAVRGSSAGGYTTLCALTFHDFFRAGASYYGIADVELLMKDSHKFESHYDHTLLGPYPASQALYHDRSPIHFVDRLNCPLLLLGGLEDKIVPPNQSQCLFDALKAKGIPVAYLTFEGEQHGFRRAESIRRALEAELYFYGKVFGFCPSDPLPPLVIENLS